MSGSILLLFVGFLYILLFGGLSYFRREGLSAQFAIEALLLTLVASGLGYFFGYTIHPILLLLVLYLITMRVRLLVDFANGFASRGKHDLAIRLYQVATKLWPDRANRLIVQVNQGVLNLQRGQLDDAIIQFNEVIGRTGEGYLGVKYEAAAHYNLGVALRRKGLISQAMAEFNSAIDSWPVSLYAQRAQTALNQMRHKEAHKELNESGADDQ